jgi:hypothetical protein
MKKAQQEQKETKVKIGMVHMGGPNYRTYREHAVFILSTNISTLLF